MTQFIQTTEIQDYLDQGLPLIDVRDAKEFAEGHIEGATNVPMAEIDNYSSPEDKVILICKKGLRSQKAAKTFEKKGYDVVCVTGGMDTYSGPIVGGK